MSKDPPAKFRPGKFFLRLLMRCFLLLTLYVLSIGPMYWQWEDARFTGGNDGLLVFYMPLMLASEVSPTFRTAINRYIDMWAYS